MGIYESVRTRICNNKIEDIKKKHLYLAYLRMHMMFPGLHLDDMMSHEGGYQGWHVLLANEVINVRGTGTLRDNFHYPCAFLSIEHVLDELLDYHESCARDHEDDIDHELEMVVHVNTVKLWLLEMKPTEVDEVVDSLHSLYLYHANENDTKEEEDEKPCATLHDCADILTWIMQFSN